MRGGKFRAMVVTPVAEQPMRSGPISTKLKRESGSSARRGIGTFTLSRPTGEYDLLGNQLFESGQLRFDTVYRFKGQQAPAIILTDVDPNPGRPDHAQRLLFTGMTRATVRLELVLREGNSACQKLMNI